MCVCVCVCVCVSVCAHHPHTRLGRRGRRDNAALPIQHRVVASGYRPSSTPRAGRRFLTPFTAPAPKMALSHAAVRQSTPSVSLHFVAIFLLSSRRSGFLLNGMRDPLRMFLLGLKGKENVSFPNVRQLNSISLHPHSWTDLVKPKKRWSWLNTGTTRTDQLERTEDQGPGLNSGSWNLNTRKKTDIVLGSCQEEREQQKNRTKWTKSGNKSPKPRPDVSSYSTVSIPRSSLTRLWGTTNWWIG